MKQKLLLGVLSVVMLFSFSSAQTIGDIDLDFCHEEMNASGDVEIISRTNALNLDLLEEEEGSICMEFTNKSDKDLLIDLVFTDGTVTNDEYQNKACQDGVGESTFAKYVEGPKGSLTIPAHGVVRHNASIKVPVGEVGELHGCVLYQLVGVSDGSASKMFAIRVKKANFVDVLVEGVLEVVLQFKDLEIDTTVKDKSNSPEIIVYKDADTKKLFYKFVLENVGSVDVDADIVVMTKTFFGAETVLLTESKTILARNELKIEGELLNLPWYGGPVTIISVAEYNAISRLTLLADDQKVNKIVEVEAKFFACMIYVLIILLLILIVLLLLSARRKRKQHKHEKKVVAKKKSSVKKSKK